MKSPRQVVIFGVITGILVAAIHIALISINPVSTAPLRGLINLLVAISIGIVWGIRGKEHGTKLAALMGFVTGCILAFVGVASVLINPAIVGTNPFASLESILRIAAGLMAGVAIASWITAGLAALVAWPIQFALNNEDS